MQVLGGGYKTTCETDASCNLYVVLVLYKTKVLDEAGVHSGWETVCDYVRFWSPASSSAEFHHAAMSAVAAHLKANKKVVDLTRLRVWSDGHGSTYRGFGCSYSETTFIPYTSPSSAARAFESPGLRILVG